jgi:hypothetical protein
MKNKEMTPAGGEQLRRDDESVNVADIAEESVGGKGFDVISDTNEHTPTGGNCYCAIHFLASSVVAAFEVDESAPVDGTIAGVTFSAGTVIYGKFTSITLTSGTCIAYNGAI